MAIQIINTGSSANAGNGDSIRAAFIKVNQNFAELEAKSITTSVQFYNLIPLATDTYNIGNNFTKWNNLYLNQSIYFDSNILAVNTLGNLTFNGEPIVGTAVGDTAPTDATTGTTWFDTNSGLLFIYYDSGWIQAGGSGSGSGGSTNLLAVASDVLPQSNNVYNLGSTGTRWENLFVGNSVNISGYTVTVNTSLSTTTTLVVDGNPLFGPAGPAGPTGPSGPTGLLGGITYNVTNNGTNQSFIFNSGVDGDPTINLVRGWTYYFEIDDLGNAFWIKTAPSAGIGDQYNFGVDNNGTGTGLITFSVPLDAPNNLYYTSQFYPAMQGLFNILNNGDTGPTGPSGPRGPTGPSADQSLNTTSTVRFADLTVTGESNFLGSVYFNSNVTYVQTTNTVYTDNMIELHEPPAGGSFVVSSTSTGFVVNGSEDPKITLVRGYTYTFSINTPGDNFWIKTDPTTGIVDAYNIGVTNNGTNNGTLTFIVPDAAPNLLYYVSEVNSAKQGQIRIVNIGDDTYVWDYNDNKDIGIKFHYYNTLTSTGSNAALILSNQSKYLEWFESGNEDGAGVYSGSYGTFKTGGLVFGDDTQQITAFLGTGTLVSLAVSATFAQSFNTNTVITTSINVDGGVVRGNVAPNNSSTTQVGYLVVPQIRTNFDYTLQLNDQGKHIYSTTASGIQNIVIPDESTVDFPIGTAVTVVLKGLGSIQITTSTGIELYLSGSDLTGNRLVSDNGMATILKVDTGTWFINGTGIT